MSESQVVEAKPIVPANEEVVQQALKIAQDRQGNPQLPHGASMDRFIGVALEKGDVGSLRELLALRREEHRDMERQAYAAAIVQFQALCPTVIRTGLNTRFGNQYAQWEAAHVQINPALKHAGLGVTHRLSTDAQGIITVTAQCRHSLGHIEETSLSAKADRLVSKEGKEVRTETQSMKSTITTLKCMTAFALLGINSRDRKKDEELNATIKAAIDVEDDDGNTSAWPTTPPQPKPQSIGTDEDKAKTAFWNVCKRKACVNFTAAQARVIFAKVQEYSGKVSAVDCLEYIERNTVALSANGDICEAVPPPPDDSQATPAGLTPAVPSPLPAESPSISPWACDECGVVYPVKTAGGKCLTPKCLGVVKKVE